MSRTWVLTFFFFVAPSSALTVDADNFSLGTDLGNAFPGVTLSVQGEPGTAVISSSGFSSFLQRNIATTGSLVFGQNPGVGPSIDPEQSWNEIEYGLLRADFANPASFVQIDIIFDDDDTGVLRAFDAQGTLIQEVSGSGDGRTSTPFFSPSITRSQADIAYILAGGINRESVFLDNLEVTLVPLPPAVVFLITGILGILPMFRRNRLNG